MSIMKTQQVLRSLTAITVTAVLFAACNKDKASQKVLNLIAINDSKSEVVNVKLKSQKTMDKQTFLIGCRSMPSATFNAKNKTFGYLDCNDVYHIIDVETGVKIKQIPLHTYINMVVVDTIRNVLIGHYSIRDENEDKYNSYVLTINLNDGSIISDKSSANGVWDATTYFFRDIENEYVLLNSIDNVLVFISPYTGSTIRTLNLDTDMLINGIYDRKNNRLIGSYSERNGENDYVFYIITVDLNTGKTLSKVVAQGLNSCYAFESDYDAETNRYVLVSDKKEALFFDVATGKVNERYQLDFDVTSLKVWRSEK